jgi:aspartyl protease family protein
MAGSDPKIVVKDETFVPKDIVPTNVVTLYQPVAGTFSVTVKINSTPINVLIDTGATSVSLTPEDATKVHDAITPRGGQVQITMAVGTALALPIVIGSITIGGIELRDVDGLILPDGAKNSLLGMTFLRRIGHVELSGDTLRLTQ